MIPSVYFAGRTGRREYFRALASKLWIRTSSRWVLNDACEPTPENSAMFWEIDFQDIRRSDWLICQADEGLRGALVEVGYALANNIPVILVGDCAEFGTWQHHKSIRKVSNMDEALDIVVWRPK